MEMFGRFVVPGDTKASVANWCKVFYLINS